jgi:hypothetical protein
MPGRFAENDRLMPSSGWMRKTSTLGLASRRSQKSPGHGAKELHGGQFELHGNLGEPVRHAFSGAQKKWHARPAPAFDRRAQSNERFGIGRAVHGFLVAVGTDRLTIDGSSVILPAHHRSVYLGAAQGDEVTEYFQFGVGDILGRRARLRA